jgi:tRNA G18 (ribose-2'-O)-methylase SpoU
VLRLLESGFAVESVLVSDRREEALAPRVPEHVPLLVMPQKLAEELVGYNFHVGVLACGLRRAGLKLSEVASTSGPLLLAACDGVSDPENVGSIIRLCAGFGASGLILGPGCCDPFSRRVLRVSMGTALGLPIVESDNLVRDLRALGEAFHVETFATVLDAAAEPLSTIKPPERSALVFGNEKHGLSRPVMNACRRRITIPMQPGADSLNVAVSAGICLYHFAGGVV